MKRHYFSLQSKTKFTFLAIILLAFTGALLIPRHSRSQINRLSLTHKNPATPALIRHIFIPDAPPYLQPGLAPDQVDKHRAHFSLHKEQQINLWVPAGAILNASSSHVKKIHARVSTSIGVSHPLEWRQSKTAQHHVAGPWPRSAHVIIQTGSEQGSDIELWLEQVQEIIPPPLFRKHVAEGSSELFFLQDANSGSTGWVMPEPSASWTVDGPCYIELTSAVLRHIDATDERIFYTLALRLDDAPWQFIHKLSRAPSPQGLTSPIRDRMALEPQTRWIFIPEGKHNLAVLCQRPTLISCVSTHKPLWLSPVNEARFPQSSMLHTLFPPTPATNHRDKMLRNNRVRNAGLNLANSAYTHLNQELTQPDREDLTQVVNSASYWQPVLPQTPPDAVWSRPFWPAQHWNTKSTDLFLSPAETSTGITSDKQAYWCRLNPGQRVAFRAPEKHGIWIKLAFSGTSPANISWRTEQKHGEISYSPPHDQQEGPSPQALALYGSNVSHKWEFTQQHDNAWLPHRSGSATLMFIPGAKNLELRVSSATNAGVMLAAWQRNDLEFRLDEEGYLVKIASIPNVLNILHNFLHHNSSEESLEEYIHTTSQQLQDAGVLTPDNLSNLHNHWLPLLRFIDSRWQMASAMLPPPQQITDKPALLHDNANTPIWPRTIECARQWREHGSGGLTLLSDLIQVKEHYLAKQLAYVLIRDTNAETAMQVLQNAQAWMQVNDFLTLAACNFYHHGSVASAKELCRALTNQSLYQHALTLGLCLPAGERPVAALLEATIGLHYDQTASELLDSLPEQSQGKWRQIMQLSRDNSSCSSETHAGKNASMPMQDQGTDTSWANLIRRCRRLLTTTDAAARLLQWQKIRAMLPHPRHWESAHQLWYRYARTLDLDNPSQAQTLTGVVASKERPAIVRLAGPARLRFTLRPLHKHLDAAETTVFAQIYSEHEQILVPIWNNRPSQTLKGKHNLNPGHAQEVVIDVPAGMQQISISSSLLPVWVDVDQEAPLVDIPGLPDNSVASIAAWLQHRAPKLHPHHGSAETARLWSLNKHTQQWESTTLHHWSLSPQNINAEEQDWDFLCSIAPPQQTRLGVDGMDAQAFDPWQDIVSHIATTPEDKIKWTELAAQTTLLAETYPAWDKARAVQQYVKQHTQWQRLSGVHSNGGIVIQPLSSWQPQAPEMRLRQALLPALNNNQVLLFRGEDLNMSLELERTSNISIEVEQLKLALIPSKPLQINWQLDTDPVQHLSVADKSSLKVQLSAGKHRLRFWLERNWANQYVAISSPDLAQICAQNRCSALTPRPNNQRLWWRATATEPLMVDLHGPAWYRIDCLTEDGVISTERVVTTASASMKLAPLDTGTQKLYRIFRREAEHNVARNPPTLRPEVNRLAEAQECKAESVATWEDAKLHKSISSPGTWSAGTGWRERSLLDEDTPGTSRERFGFVKLGVYRRVDSFKDAVTYTYTGAKLRIREHGGPVVHLQNNWWIYPGQNPWTWTASAQAWLQNPGADRASFSNLTQTWSAYARMQAEYLWQDDATFRNSLRLGVFGRLLSEDEIRKGWEKNTDQDIFSPYKYAHKWGLKIADIRAWRPTIDSRFSSKLELTSNENLTPDAARATLGWQQLWHESVSTQIEYKLSHYFNDSDRDASRLRHTIAARVLIDVPIEPEYNRWRLDLGLRGDPEQDTWLASISLNLYWDKHKRWYDLPPNNLPFKQLRRWLSYIRPLQEHNDD